MKIVKRFFMICIGLSFCNIQASMQSRSVVAKSGSNLQKLVDDCKSHLKDQEQELANEYKLLQVNRMDLVTECNDFPRIVSEARKYQRDPIKSILEELEEHDGIIKRSKTIRKKFEYIAAQNKRQFPDFNYFYAYLYTQIPGQQAESAVQILRDNGNWQHQATGKKCRLYVEVDREQMLENQEILNQSSGFQALIIAKNAALKQLHAQLQPKKAELTKLNEEFNKINERRRLSIQAQPWSPHFPRGLARSEEDSVRSEVKRLKGEIKTLHEKFMKGPFAAYVTQAKQHREELKQSRQQDVVTLVQSGKCHSQKSSLYHLAASMQAVHVQDNGKINQPRNHEIIFPGKNQKK